MNARIVIVGGIVDDASAPARARRSLETAEPIIRISSREGTL